MIFMNVIESFYYYSISDYAYLLRNFQKSITEPCTVLLVVLEGLLPLSRSATVVRDFENADEQEGEDGAKEDKEDGEEDEDENYEEDEEGDDGGEDEEVEEDK